MLRDFLIDFAGSILLLASAIMLLEAFLRWSPL